MEHTFKTIPDEILKDLSKRDLLTLLQGEQSIRQQLESFITDLKERYKDLEEQKMEVEGKFIRLKKRIFSPKSEKSRKPIKKDKPKKKKKIRKTCKRLPSERYPNIPVEEVEIELLDNPECDACGGEMTDSGMKEASETFTVIPKRYIVTRSFRKKYRCPCCHGSIVTTPPVPRIVPKSSYSDEMVIDVAMSKFCDLIPIERYCKMAFRGSGIELPPNSLIGLTHKLADFLEPIYKEGLFQEVTNELVLRADETTHNMLEGDEKKNWFLWGFSSSKAVYFELHNTRSGSVASNILIEANSEYLLSDVYSGYSKAIKEANIQRTELDKKPIEQAFCNAHARRKFVEVDAIEAEYYVSQYRRLYKLHKYGFTCDEEKKVRIWNICQKIFSKMRGRAENDIENVSKHSGLAKAINYFIKNYEGLAKFLLVSEIPIDNNAQERAFRSPVVGRKTWSGTHSKRGAKTTAILFSISESCKMLGVNPREYVQNVVRLIHAGRKWLTPAQYLETQQK